MKNFFVFIFILTSFLTVSSSKIYSQDWTLGVKGGLNLSKLRVINGAETSSMVGLHLGGYANFNVTDQIGIQPEIQASFQGYENNIAENISLVYFNIPLLVKYYLADQFSVHAGPQVGFLISAEDEREDILKSTDVGVAAGAEYQLMDKVGIGGRYTIGLNNILEISENEIEWKSRNFQVFVTYKLSD